MLGALWGGMSPPNGSGAAARRFGTHGRAAAGALAAGVSPGHGPVLDALDPRYGIAAGLRPGGGAELAASGRATADGAGGGLLTTELVAPL